MQFRPFLLRLAEQLLGAHGPDLGRIAVVLPSRRAGLVLRKYLAQVHGAPLWSPELIDMGTFLERTSGYRQAHITELLGILHDHLSPSSSKQPLALSRFLASATTTLRDMSEVDGHLLETSRFYRHVEEYRALEEWGGDLGGSTSGSQQTPGDTLTGSGHEAFRRSMEKLGLGTSGSLARRCAELSIAGTLQLPWDKVWFAGLNALDPATTTVIKHLQATGTGAVAWDADPFYVEDLLQEAGHYLRRSIAQIGPGVLPLEPAIVELERSVRQVEVPDAFAQATYVTQRLAALSPAERASTAIVLADETLLWPLLEHWPEDLGPVNVTMGVPLASMPLNDLIGRLLALRANSRAGRGLHSTELAAVVLHPLLLGGTAGAWLRNELVHGRSSWLDQEQCTRLTDKLPAADASYWRMCFPLDPRASENPGSAVLGLLQWVLHQHPDDALIGHQVRRMQEFQERLHGTLERLQALLFDHHGYVRLRDRLLREERLALFGEALEGTQIMGVLETRAIDHPRVIILSAYEGVLPPSGAQESWIPHTIRRAHGLPVPSDSAAIAAYHFNRCLQRAPFVELVHPASVADAPGEVTRFAAQWRTDVVDRSHTSWTTLSYAGQANRHAAGSWVVAKSPAILERLQALCLAGLAPSTIATYLRCPLDLHIKHVLGVRSPAVNDGALGDDVLGRAVHAVLETVHSGHGERTLSGAELIAFLPRLPSMLRDELLKEYPAPMLESGHFRLRMDMAGAAVGQYLEAEATLVDRGAVKVLSLEEDLRVELGPGVFIHGRCDRIEERDGMVVVLDLKTGTVRDGALRIASLDRSSFGPEQRTALQLVIYAWAYLELHPEVRSISAAVIPLQRPTNASGEFLTIAGSTVLTREDLAPTRIMLMELVNEILDPSMPFEHDPESTYCVACVA